MTEENDTQNTEEDVQADAPAEDTYANLSAPQDVPEGDDSGKAEVQATMDAINEVGYSGQTADPTPRENYSLETGPDAPTPETHDEAAAAVVQHQKENL